MDTADIFLMGPMGMQAFWIWLTLGLVLLGAETLLGTQWLLWSAAAAGLVAVICLTGLPFGIVIQVALFVILSLLGAVLTRRFLKVSGPHHGDINDPHLRIVGKQADVLSGFDAVTGGERTGRVLFDGVEWPAVLDAPDSDDTFAASDRVVVTAVRDGRMFVKSAG